VVTAVAVDEPGRAGAASTRAPGGSRSPACLHPTPAASSAAVEPARPAEARPAPFGGARQDVPELLSKAAILARLLRSAPADPRTSGAHRSGNSCAARCSSRSAGARAATSYTISTRFPAGSRSSVFRLVLPVSCGGWTTGVPAGLDRSNAASTSSVHTVPGPRPKPSSVSPTSWRGLLSDEPDPEHARQRVGVRGRVGVRVGSHGAPLGGTDGIR
jgi:hypothetical protein